MKKFIIIVGISMLLTTGCSKNDTTDVFSQSTSTPETSATTSTQASATVEPTVPTKNKELTKDEIDNKLMEINNWMIGDIWNDGFCLIRDYAERGKDPSGKEIDIEFALRNFDEIVNKRKDYGVFIDSLTAETYKDLQSYWTKTNEQIGKMYELYEANPLTANDANYPVDTTLFVQYRNAFSDEVDKIYSMQSIPTNATTEITPSFAPEIISPKFEQFEKGLEANKINYQKVDKLAILVGAKEGYGYNLDDENAVELYLFDKDSDAYKEAFKNNKITLQGMNMAIEVTFNDDIAIFYNGNSAEQATIEKIFADLK